MLAILPYLLRSRVYARECIIFNHHALHEFFLRAMSGIVGRNLGEKEKGREMWVEMKLDIKPLKSKINRSQLEIFSQLVHQLNFRSLHDALQSGTAKITR